jgi:hypothetical protein
MITLAELGEGLGSAVLGVESSRVEGWGLRVEGRGLRVEG